MPGVFWDQDHAKHYQAHIDFLNHPFYGQRIPIENRKQLEEHMRIHVACMYGKGEANMGSLQDQEVLDTAQAEALIPQQQVDPKALEQLAGQGGQAQGPSPTEQANQSQEQLGSQMGG